MATESVWVSWNYWHSVEYLHDTFSDLGMDTISPTSMDSSSNRSQADQGDLTNDQLSGWMAGSSDSTPYLEARFGQAIRAVKIVTRGNKVDKWVTRYTIKYLDAEAQALVDYKVGANTKS